MKIMITYTVTTYTPGDTEPTVIHDAADNRNTALRAAGAAAITALDSLTTTNNSTLPYLSIVVDDELLVMLAVGRDATGQPDLTTALIELHARLAD